MKELYLVSNQHLSKLIVTFCYECIFISILYDIFGNTDALAHFKNSYFKILEQSGIIEIHTFEYERIKNFCDCKTHSFVLPNP